MANKKQVETNSFVNVKRWIDEWDFKNENTNSHTHKIHRYPAMFIPQLVNKLLQEYSEAGETVLDIFNGSGSTMVEGVLTNRNVTGIEINPLAIKIAEAKVNIWDVNKFDNAYESVKKEFLKKDLKYKIIEYDRIDFWFAPDAIENLSRLLHCIRTIKDKKICNFFEISFSEIIREVSLCKHSGFKQHKDPKKEKNVWDMQNIFNKFSDTLNENFKGYKDFYNIAKESESKVNTIEGNSTTLFKDIKKESVDLILTSPPYGDSSTTVAYGQFSKLSSLFLGLKSNNTNIDSGNIDKELLGGKIRHIDLDCENITRKSRTLYNYVNFFEMKLQTETDKEIHKKLTKRFKEVISFYIDLDLCIKNGVKYLKKNKYFILVTGSRVVKEIKLHTDIICAEFAEFYGMNLEGILYRDIPNKRMPSKVSATNIKGDVSPTMTKESIVILKKTKHSLDKLN